MADYTEITSTSWLGRIGSSLKGIVFGVILIALAFVLFFFNEGRAVKRYKTLKEGAGSVIPIGAETVDAANAGKLVHLMGLATTDEVLQDTAFGISENAMRLKRTVEMFQWKESQKKRTKKKLGGGEETVTEYSYQKVWSKSLVSSSNFKQSQSHQNPSTMPYSPMDLVAGKATVGGFSLTKALVRKMSDFETLAPKEVPAALLGKVKLQGDLFYMGKNPAVPEIGDTRIGFSVVRPGEVSIVATQVGQTFEPYRSKSGGTILMLLSGSHSADAMFQQAMDGNKILTWILRLIGFILMFVGLTMIFKPLSVIADVVPFIGSLVAAGTGLIAFLLAALLSILTIAVAWIVYRPLLGLVLLAVAGGLAFLMKGKLKLAGSARK